MTGMELDMKVIIMDPSRLKYDFGLSDRANRGTMVVVTVRPRHQTTWRGGGGG